ncbi:MAG: hypothetical protein HYX32_11240 [Actinobacteria bacterium]|nr:hypothetical protein [Actinomycetota bacterium]
MHTGTRATAALAATLLMSLLAACAANGTTTTDQAGVSKRLGGGLGQAAADLGPGLGGSSSTVPDGAGETTTAPPEETTTAPPTVTTSRVTVSQPPPTQPPPTQPPPTQATVTLPPANNEPSPTVQASVTGGGGPNCGAGTVSLSWSSNVSTVQLSATNGTTETLGATGTKDFPFSCPGTVTYNFNVSNSRGTAKANVTASGSS